MIDRVQVPSPTTAPAPKYARGRALSRGPIAPATVRSPTAETGGHRVEQRVRRARAALRVRSYEQAPVRQSADRWRDDGVGRVRLLERDGRFAGVGRARRIGCP